MRAIVFIATGVAALLLTTGPGGAAQSTVPGEAALEVCHDCFWRTFPAEWKADAIGFYEKLRPSDPLVIGDVEYILWRATGVPRCVARDRYRHVATHTRDGYRRLSALAVLGFTGPECHAEGTAELIEASRLSASLGLAGKARALQAAAEGGAAFADQAIDAAVHVPPGATRFVLGESRLELSDGARIGTQVERVARDWVSYQMGWDRTGGPLPAAAILDYHEGAFTRAIVAGIRADVHPLSGTVVANRDGRWLAPDEEGVFRFEVLADKVQYPTSHVRGHFAWVEDTHGVSAIAGQALERHMDVVIACGDSDGKAQAAFYLATRGVHVIFPGDRFQDRLLGYRAPGVLLGGAPVRAAHGRVLIGGQPVAFSREEPIVVSTTTGTYPVQYYDAPARYFRRLSEFAALTLVEVELDAVDQIDRVLREADRIGASAVGVRVMTDVEDARLRAWLQGSAGRRAVLFHSGLDPHAQGLFRDFPQQVTFGDLHPRFS